MMRFKWRYPIFALMILVVFVAVCFGFARAILDSKPRSSPLSAGQEVTLRSDYLTFDESGEAAYTRGTRCIVLRDLAASPESRWDQQRRIEVRVADGSHKGAVLQLPRWLFWAR